MAIKLSGDTIIDDNRVVVNADKIGIGTTNPQVALEIFSGDVGIGTTNPNASNIKASLDSNTNILAVGIVTAKEYYGTFKGTVEADPEITLDKITEGNSSVEVVDPNSDTNAFIKIVVAGTEKQRILSSGVVNIKNVEGTGLNISGSNGVGIELKTVNSSATEKRDAHLEIINESDNTIAKQVGRVQSDGGSAWIWETQPSGDRSARRVERLRITADGHVGIGTTLPKAPVVSGNTKTLAVGIVTANEFYGDYYGTFKGDIDPSVGVITSLIKQGNTKAEVVDTGSDGHFLVETENDERLRIISNGFVGIGTTIPGNPLHISSSSDEPLLVHSTSSNSFIRFQNSGGSNGYIGYLEDQELSFLTIGQERVRITSTGHVGIGTTLPKAPVVSGNTKTLAVGIVTANELYGTFYGTIDTGVGLAADTIKTVASTSNATHYLTFVDSNNGSETSESVYTDGGITYQPNVDRLGITTIKPGQILDSSNNSGTEDYVIRADGAGGWTWGQIDAGSVGTLNFTDLNDTPADYTGHAHKFVRVNKDGATNNGTALEFVDGTDAGKTYTLKSVASVNDVILRLNDGTATNDDVKITKGTGITFANISDDGFTINASGGGTGTLTDLDVKQFSGHHGSTPRAERSCSNPIDVTVDSTAGIATIGIGSTSNAYGKRYIQDTVPSTDVCEGDIWFDTSTTTSSTEIDKVALIQDEKPNGTNAGRPASLNNWLTRDLNTIYDTSTLGITSTSDGKFSLPAGSYAINISVPGYHCGFFQARLAYNVNSDFSGTTNYVYGSSQFSGQGVSGGGYIYSHSVDRSRADAVVTLSSLTYFRVEQNTSASDGGVSNHDYGQSASRGVKEIYTQVRVQDLATAAKEGGGSGFTDKIEEGNTKAEVVDNNGDGHFLVETEGTERLRITHSGIVNMGRAITDDPVTATGDVNAGLKLLGATSASTPGDSFGLVANAKDIVGIFNRTNVSGGGRIVEYKYNATVVGAVESDASNNLKLLGESATIFEVGGTERLRINTNGHVVPGTDSTYDIGENTNRFANGYFDTLYGDGSNLTNVSATGGSIKLLPEKASTSGTEVFFDNIPSDALEITLMWVGVSASGTNNFMVQLGTASGYIETGYDSLSQNEGGGDDTPATDCFLIRSDANNHVRTGAMVIKKSSGSSYVQTGSFALNPSGVQGGTQTYGSLTSVSGTVDRLRVKLNGTNTFDAGTMSVSYKTSGGSSTTGSVLGQVVAWAGNINNIPSEFVLCDGRELDKTTYSDLFAILGTIHNTGGEASNVFRVPDLRDKFIVGAHSDGADTTYPQVRPGTTGGTANASLPAHYHNMPGDDQLAFANGKSGGTQGGLTPTWVGTSAGYDDTFSYDATSTNNGGGKLWRTTTVGITDASKANLPPYYALAYIINVTGNTVTIGVTDKIIEGDTSAEVIDTGTDGRFVVKTENTERLRITGIGSVGIGTDSPIHRFSVFGNTNDRERFAVRETTGTSFNPDTISDIILNNAGGGAEATQVKGVINMGSSYKDSTHQAGSGHWSAVKLHLYKDSNPNNIYGLGVSNGMMEIQTDANLGFFVGNAGATGSRIERFRVNTAGHVVPGADDAYDLGQLASMSVPNRRWRNIYTGDLHLSNVGREGGNDVDGTTGSWKIQEGTDNIFLINNTTGKKYKINMTEVT